MKMKKEWYDQIALYNKLQREMKTAKVIAWLLIAIIVTMIIVSL